MLWNAKNGCVNIGDTDMNYVSFGHGNKALLVNDFGEAVEEPAYSA